MQFYTVYTARHELLFRAPLEPLCRILGLRPEARQRILAEATQGAPCELHFSHRKPLGEARLDVYKDEAR